MIKRPIFSYIKKLNKPVFSTLELCQLSGKSPSAVTQALNYLVTQEIIDKLSRGVWADTDSQGFSPYAAIPYLAAGARAYVSFLSALHIYGIVGQIPQVITIAGIAHSKIIRTSVGVFSFHRIAPQFFTGFDWYSGEASFLIAEPEKALVDCLYLSARKKNQFVNFPELDFSGNFSFKKARQWIAKISDEKIRKSVIKKIDTLEAGICVHAKPLIAQKQSLTKKGGKDSDKRIAVSE